MLPNSPEGIPFGLRLNMYSSFGFNGSIGQLIGPKILSLTDNPFLLHKTLPFLEIIISLRGSGV